MKVRKVRGPILDKLYAELKRCGSRATPPWDRTCGQIPPGWSSRAALHRQPAPRRRLRPAQQRRAARPQRRRRDHAPALRRPGPRSGQASRPIPRTADRQIYSAISSALTWPHATTGRSATWPGTPDRRISAGSKPERGDLCACPRVPAARACRRHPSLTRPRVPPGGPKQYSC
jgi:hypothetical protein